MNHAHCDFDNALVQTQKRLNNIAGTLSENIGVRDFCLVGGAVRDIFLGELTNKRINVGDIKDFDIILPYPPKDIEKKTNILWRRKNSYGGIKCCIQNVGIVDIFQQYTNDVPALVANNFDFNCNSLYYSYLSQRLEISAYFLNFLETSLLRKCVGYNGTDESIAVRAIKFQTLFQKNFGIDSAISYEIMEHIVKSNPVLAKQYAYAKINDVEIRRTVLRNYNYLKHTR